MNWKKILGYTILGAFFIVGIASAIILYGWYVFLYFGLLVVLGSLFSFALWLIKQ